MILLIDNYDSFSYNLYQYLGTINPDIKVIRNDELKPEEIFKLNPTSIIISPGPGYPKDAGFIEDIIKLDEEKKVPLLGVCLGHQAIIEAFGGKIVHAKKIMHGKQDEIKIDNDNILFKGLDNKIIAARYHSLVGENPSNKLIVTAYDSDNEIMAVMHENKKIFGVQFHPESIMSNDGMTILRNFLNIK